MKVVYFGSDVFLSCFEYFVQKHQVLALYTYHNEEDYFTEYSIVKRAKQLHIPVYYQSITTEQIRNYVCNDGCALFFVAEYNRILPIPEDLTAFRGINIHSSLLPQGRSYYPIEAAMERALSTTGVTMHKLFSKLDQGDILAQHRIDITADMDSIDIYLHCAAHAREMLEQIIPKLDDYWQLAQPQTSCLPYWKRPDTHLLTLQNEMTRAQALALFRAYNAMTQVQIQDTWYHVTALSAGTGPMDVPLRILSPDRALYQVCDGHLRLHIHRMEESI